MAAVDDDGLHEADKQHVEDELEWVPLSLTLVEYPQGKHIFNRCEFRSTMVVCMLCFSYKHYLFYIRNVLLKQITLFIMFSYKIHSLERILKSAAQITFDISMW